MQVLSTSTRHDRLCIGGAALAGACIILLVAVALSAGVASAHGGGGHGDTTATNSAGNTSDVCSFEKAGWRDAQSVAGVRIMEEQVCRPDNPNVVAASVKGTNNVPMSVLMKSGLGRDAVVKSNDRDGDGDPDDINITLEVAGINEYNSQSVKEAIAPGVKPAFWVFAPKTRGMMREGTTAASVIRMPTPPIRVEQGDRVRVTVENTHYVPHTIHFHGVDHPFEVNGSGNDGVPQTSEKPIMPGESRTYEFTPRQPGSMFYHCHVVPDVHVLMGLNGMFVIEENRSNNSVQTFNIGAGKVRHPSKAVRENYTTDYDLQYQEVDAKLHSITQTYNDPRVIAKKMNREYDRAEEAPDYFLLNGRSFPYTLRDSLIVVQPNERYRLRVMNGGSETLSLHTHGHKVTVEAYDGVEVSERQEITRDVVTLTAAQRVDLTLNTTTDGLHSYGPGIWFMHDHREQAVTTDGIGPGGNINMIVYESYLGSEGIPETNTDISRFFNASYYRGEQPVWGPLSTKYFGEPPANASTAMRTGNGSDGHQHGNDGADDDEAPAMAVGVVLVVGLLGLAVVGPRVYRGEWP